ncbi:unnamed protein product [Closterium sp. Naga37s-1]|nr:unnamed protein product [Closterium sp. Naga37s-1]
MYPSETYKSIKFPSLLLPISFSPFPPFSLQSTCLPSSILPTPSPLPHATCYPLTGYHNLLDRMAGRQPCTARACSGSTTQAALSSSLLPARKPAQDMREWPCLRPTQNQASSELIFLSGATTGGGASVGASEDHTASQLNPFPSLFLLSMSAPRLSPHCRAHSPLSPHCPAHSAHSPLRPYCASVIS